jgi:hypothetical protein
MIQAILSYQFILQKGETGVFKPEFKPVCLVFNNKDFSRNNYSELIDELDLFAIFYQHTTGITERADDANKFFLGRLKQTPYQVISMYLQDSAENQFMTVSIFELDDEIGIFEDQVKKMETQLKPLYEDFIKMKGFNLDKIESEFKFTIFQVDRLTELDKLQKVALIYQNDERLKILEILRERPVSKKELKEILERMKPNPNIDLLLQPFLQLNLIRRDWIKGETGKKKIDVKFQGEYLFLVKDLIFARFPSKDSIHRIKSGKHEVYKEYKKKINEYFANYNVNNQSSEELKELSSALLNPDCFDFYSLMVNNYYPLDKLPRIFSEFVDSKSIVEILTKLNIITTLKDKKGKSWVALLTEIKPLISFPEYLLVKVRDLYRTEKKDEKITYEIAKKALDLLEVTYPEKVKF